MARALQKEVPLIAREFKRVESVNAIAVAGKEFAVGTVVVWRQINQRRNAMTRKLDRFSITQGDNEDDCLKPTAGCRPSWSHTDVSLMLY